jgi:cell cycle checkpoint control protein RAD9A
VSHDCAAFVRALTCLSKYGDEVLIHATPHTLSVSATSSSMSAYSRFMWDRQFFVRYEVGTTNKGKGKDREPEPAVDMDGEIEAVTGQLMAKVNDDTRPAFRALLRLSPYSRCCPY